MSIIDGKVNFKVGKFVRESLYELFNEKEISNELLKMMQKNKYSKEMLGINYALLIKNDKNEDMKNKLIISGGSRYWASGTIKINGEEFFICNDWYERHDRDNRSKFIKWFLEIEKKFQDK